MGACGHACACASSAGAAGAAAGPPPRHPRPPARHRADFHAGINEAAGAVTPGTWRGSGRVAMAVLPGRQSGDRCEGNHSSHPPTMHPMTQPCPYAGAKPVPMVQIRPPWCGAGGPCRPHGCCLATPTRGAWGPHHEHRWDRDAPITGGVWPVHGSRESSDSSILGSPATVRRCGDPPSLHPTCPPHPVFFLLTLRLQEEPKLPHLLPWQLCIAEWRGGPSSVPPWWGGSTLPVLPPPGKAVTHVHGAMRDPWDPPLSPQPHSHPSSTHGCPHPVPHTG